MLPTNILDYIARLNGRVLSTGSRVICNPPPTDTDEDWVVQVSAINRLTMFKNFLEADGWTMDSGGEYDTGDDDESGPTDIFSHVEPSEMSFASFKKDSYNIILLRTHAAFRAWASATAIAKALNLADKADRVKLFQYMFNQTSVYAPPSIHVNVRYYSGQGTFNTCQIMTMENRWEAFAPQQRVMEDRIEWI